MDVLELRPDNKDLPPKNRVRGFRTPARSRIRKSVAQAAESRRENRPTPTNLASGIRYFLLTDQVGTLRAVADSAGTIVKRIDYDSFGNIIADSNTAMTIPFGFAGGLHDRDTGLVRFGYRDYSPELGTFVSKDPLDFAGGDTNLYAYAFNDPVNLVDPAGLFFEAIWSDPAERAGNLGTAISMTEFIAYARGKTLSQLQHESDPRRLGPRSAGGPDTSYRYVVNPKNPREVIDMRHFLVVGPQGELAGLGIEFLQALGGDRHSAFDAQDLLANYLGARFFKGYNPKSPLDYELQKFFFGVLECPRN